MKEDLAVFKKLIKPVKALNFYKSIFGKELQYIGRYKDVPEITRKNFPNCTDNQIMHIALPISKETILMGAAIIDDRKNESSKYFSLYVNTESKKEAERLFNCLSENGEIKLPISEQFGDHITESV